MLTSMLTGLKGQVFKVENYAKEETEYTLILGKNYLFPWMYKTATLYKGFGKGFPNLRIEVNKRDSTKYKKKNEKNEIFEARYEDLEELSEYLEKLPSEKIEFLKKDIEKIPEKIRKTLYGLLKEPLFHRKEFDPSYLFLDQNIKKISRGHSKEKTYKETNLEILSRKLSEKIYRKVFSIINIPRL